MDGYEAPRVETQAYVDGERCTIADRDWNMASFSSGLIVMAADVPDVAGLFTAAAGLGIELAFVPVELYTVPQHREDTARRVDSFVGIRAVAE